MVIESVRKLVSPPVFKDEKKNHQAYILNFILWSMILIACLYLVSSLILTPQTAAEDITLSGVGILVSILMLVMLRRGYVHQAAISLVACFWLMFTAEAIYSDGLVSPAYNIGYVLVILIAGILFEGAGALVMTLLSLAAGLGVYFLQSSASPLPQYYYPLIGYWVVSAFMFPTSAIVQYLAVRSMRRALSRAMDSEKKYRSILENIQDVYYRSDFQGRLIMASPSFLDVFGFDAMDEILGRSIAETFYQRPENRQDFLRALEAEQRVKNYELVLKRKDGSLITCDATSHYVYDEKGEVTGIEGVLHDVSERKSAEAELRRLNRTLRTISKCNEVLVRSSNEDDLLREVCKAVVETGEYQLACINLVETNMSGGYQPGYSYCYRDDKLLREKHPASIAVWKDVPGLIRLATSDRLPVYFNRLPDQHQDHILAPFLNLDGRGSLAVMPVIYEATIFGILSIFSAQENAFDDNEVRLITEMASDLSYGLHTQRVRAERKNFQDILEATNQELEYAYDATLEGWSQALELRERETAGHSQRVVELTLAIAKALDIPEAQYVHIRRGALLHDIGKMGIPDSILLKPGPLTEDEWRTMRHHPIYAYNLLKGVPYLFPAVDIPYSHHERWDGYGYPNKLKAEAIPLAARIFAVVDVWDALTSDRPYRLAWTPEESLTYIIEQSGKRFDPLVVQKFSQIISLSLRVQSPRAAPAGRFQDRPGQL